jgi:hypothetical protein
MALTLSSIVDAAERARSWSEALEELPKLRTLEQNLPGVFERLVGVLERFEKKHGRRARFVAMDFGDQYWGDVGQHQQIYEFYMALTAHSAEGTIARALAGLPERRDKNGNILWGNTQIGDVQVTNSVLIDCELEKGEVKDSVLIGTRARKILADRAFDVESAVHALSLAPRSGSYKVVSAEPVVAKAGERLTTLFLPDRATALMRVNEETDLRDQAATYDVPILGNALAFRMAHELMSRIEAEELAERRERATNDVLSAPTTES